MFNKKNNIITLILLNIIILVPGLYIIIHGILFGAISNQPGINIKGLGYLKPFTMDSNILAIITSLLIFIYYIIKLKNKKNNIPKWIIILHLMSTTCLVLTFLVTLLFLTPTIGLKNNNIFMMYEKELLLFHFINPILSLISFIIISKQYKFNYIDTILGEIPIFIYSIIYLLMVIVFKKWNDFYNFTLNGKYYLVPFVFIFMNIISYIISLLLTKIKNKT